jgi:glutamyl-tRNA reductase
MHTVNVRVTHHRADIPTLEAIAFPDVKSAMQEIAALPSVKECLVIQTCNRVEIFAAAEDADLAYHDIIDYLMDKTISRMKQHPRLAGNVPAEQVLDHMINRSKHFHDVIESDSHVPALRHLFRLVAGLESMIIGEDQILGQVRDAYNLAAAANTIGPFFQGIFQKAIHVGQRVRSETGINRGAVSIGSAAVDLAERSLGGLKGKTALLIGAGEMGILVAKSLGGKELERIIVSNRTYERGKKLAEELKCQVLPFEEIPRGIREADLLIAASSAPHAIITVERVRQALEGRKKGELLIIDVGIPRNVEEAVGKIPGVTLLNIDGLREIADRNRRQREKEAVHAVEILEEELALLIKRLYRIDVEGIVKILFQRAEQVRQKELEKAARKLGDGLTEKERAVLNDLTRVIVKKTVAPLATQIRKTAESGNEEAIRMVEQLFLDEAENRT